MDNGLRYKRTAIFYEPGKKIVHTVKNRLNFCFRGARIAMRKLGRVYLFDVERPQRDQDPPLVMTVIDHVRYSDQSELTKWTRNFAEHPLVQQVSD